MDELTNDDCMKTLDAGYIEEATVSVGDARRYTNEIRSFTTPEKMNTRRRWVNHTPQSNKLMQAIVDEVMEKHVHIPSPASLRSNAKMNVGRAIDFQAWFPSFLLPVHLRIWTICRGGKMYRLRVIPTGSNWAPALGHLFTECLGTYAASTVKGTIASAYVDNLQFLAATNEVLKMVIVAMFELCTTFCVDVNEKLGDVLSEIDRGAPYDFLGITFDHSHHTTNTSSKIRAKIADIVGIEERASQLSLRDVLSAVGVLQASATITGRCRGEHYYLVKFLRRRAAQQACLDGPADIWAFLVRGRELTRWATLELNAPNRVWLTDVSARSTRWKVFTDASDCGYGVLAFGSNGLTKVIAGPWTAKQMAWSINVREAWAVLVACQELRIHQEDEAELWIDNTSVMQCMKKQSSKAFELNEIITAIARHTIFSSVSYVKSADNRADFLTRDPRYYSQQINMISDSPLLYAAMKKTNGGPPSPYVPHCRATLSRQLENLDQGAAVSISSLSSL